MKVRTTIILMVFGILIAGAYCVNRGLYIGNEVVQESSNLGSYWHLKCKYLVASGIYVVDTGGWNTPEEARKNRYCTLFLN